jgi:hypothetical protein
MDRPQARSRAQRSTDALAKLEAPLADAWVSSASAASDGTPRPHMVPLSFVWAGDRILLAVEETSRTARNVRDSGVARVALGPTRDVVMIEAVLERVVAVGEDEELAARYAQRADWDPREDEGYVFLVMRPERIQAWREANESPGRELMRDGAWLA